MAEKPMPWFRAYPEAGNDPKFEIATVQAGLHPLMIFGAWWKVLCIAGSSPIRGSLYVTAKKRYSNAELTLMLRVSNDECNAILQTFEDLDMLDKDENGAYRVKNWEKRQFASDNSNERVKKHRSKAKSEAGNGEETLHGRYSNGGVTPPDTESDTDPDPDTDPKKTTTSSSADADFAALIRAYEQDIGVITPRIAEQMGEDLADYGLSLCVEAIAEATRQNVRKWSYVQGILRRWKNNGKTPSGSNGKSPEPHVPKTVTIVLPDGTVTEATV